MFMVVFEQGDSIPIKLGDALFIAIYNLCVTELALP